MGVLPEAVGEEEPAEAVSEFGGDGGGVMAEGERDGRHVEGERGEGGVADSVFGRDCGAQILGEEAPRVDRVDWGRHLRHGDEQQQERI